MGGQGACMHVVHVYNVHVHVIYTVVCVYVHVHKVNIHTMCIYMYMTLSVLLAYHVRVYNIATSHYSHMISHTLEKAEQ